MLVLSYIWLLALIPLLVEKNDREVQWNAKNGLLLMAAEIVIWIGLAIIQIVPIVGAIVGCLGSIVLLVGAVVLRIMAIMKATKGERFFIPFISDYVEKM